jgi:hypothetical protein
MIRASIAIALIAVATPAFASPRSTSFSFDDNRLLREGEKGGGLVHYDPSDTGAIPLVVFLHGVNEAGPPHRGLGGAFDLRTTVDDLISAGAVGALAIAGPSQTRDAWSGARLWSTFDLDSFVDATSAALGPGPTIDRSRVIVAGHSGAGCNAKGGLYAPRGKIVPLAVLALDTCMDSSFGKLLGEAAKTSAVHVFWQSAIWPRDVDGFRTALEQVSGQPASITKLPSVGINPHETVASLALQKILPTLVPPDAPDDDE